MLMDYVADSSRSALTGLEVRIDNRPVENREIGSEQWQARPQLDYADDDADRFADEIERWARPVYGAAGADGQPTVRELGAYLRRRLPQLSRALRASGCCLGECLQPARWPPPRGHLRESSPPPSRRS